MDTTGAVCPWGGHPARECPVARPDFRVIGGRGGAINGPNDRSDGMPRTRVTDYTEQDEINEAARDAAHGCCDNIDDEEEGK